MLLGLSWRICYNNIMQRLAVLVAILLASALFAAEFPVSDAVPGDPVVRGAVSVGTDGDGFLVAWTDERTDEPILLAARVTRTGQVLDPTGIPIHLGARRPQVIWNGERYLVFWTAGSSNTVSSIMVAEVNRDGSVSTPRTIVSRGRFDSYGRPVKTNGSCIVMAYSDWDAPQIRVGVLDLQARPIADYVVDEADAGNIWRLENPRQAVSVNGSEFLVSWNVSRVAAGAGETRAVRFAANGSRIDSESRRIGTSSMTVAANGTGYVVIGSTSWGVSGDLQTITEPAPFSLLIDYDLLVIDRDGRASLFSNDPYGSGSEVVQFDDRGHVDSKQRFLSPAVTVAGVSNGRDLLFVASKFQSSYKPPLTLVVVTDAAMLQPKTPEVALTSCAIPQDTPSVATNGTDTVTVWRERDGIFAARVRNDGTRLDGRGMQLSDSGELPRVVFDGERYVVAFTRYWKGDVVIRFISPADGLLRDEFHILSSYGYGVALAKSDDSVLAVWFASEGLSAVRINRLPQLTDPFPVVIKMDFGATAPVVAWNGHEFLIAWRQASGGDMPFYPRIRGMRLSSNLIPIDTASRVLIEETNAVIQNLDPSVVWDGARWLVAAQFDRYGYGTPDVRVARLDRSLTPIGVTTIGKARAPELAVANGRAWIAFKEDTPERSLHLGALTSEGTLDPNRQRVIAAPTPRFYIAPWPERFNMTSNGQQLILAYPRIAGIDTGSALRVFLSIIDPTAPERRRSVR